MKAQYCTILHKTIKYRDIRSCIDFHREYIWNGSRYQQVGDGVISYDKDSPRFLGSQIYTLVTWHMGSHSATCHLIQVNAPCLNPRPDRLILDSPTPERCKAELILVVGYIQR